jgi:hypothetical protein
MLKIGKLSCPTSPKDLETSASKFMKVRTVFQKSKFTTSLSSKLKLAQTDRKRTLNLIKQPLPSQL